MVSDREAAKKIGEAGKQRAIDVFSWETIAQDTVEVYKSLM